MVLVGVGQHEPGEILAAPLDEARIGQHDVDAGQGLVGEADAEVDHQPAAAQAVEIEVQSDLAGAAERHEQQLLVLHPQPACQFVSWTRLA